MSLMNSIEIGKNGLEAHGMRLEIAAKNIANIDTPNYVRKIPVIAATENASFASVLGTMEDDVFQTGAMPYLSGGVKYEGVVEDPTLGDKVYRPGHPDADENGYITTSNVNPIVDMADAVMAQRAYEASLSIMTIAKTMANRALEIGG